MLRKLLTYFNLVKEPVWEIVDLFNKQEVFYDNKTAYTFFKDVEIAIYHINFGVVIVRKGAAYSGTSTEFTGVEAIILDRIAVKAKKNSKLKQQRYVAVCNLENRQRLADLLKGENK